MEVDHVSRTRRICSWSGYFDHSCGADAMNRKGTWAITKDVRRQASRAWWDKDAPIHWPVDAAGKPLWKETIAPKPADPMHTNTHGEHG